jgi:hypothetical protein
MNRHRVASVDHPLGSRRRATVLAMDSPHRARLEFWRTAGFRQSGRRCHRMDWLLDWNGKSVTRRVQRGGRSTFAYEITLNMNGVARK